MNTSYPCTGRSTPAPRRGLRLAFMLIIGLSLSSFTVPLCHALHWSTGIHDPSSIVKANGLYHIWGTGNQIYHLTSPDMVRWSPATTVFSSGTWPSWINSYVPGFAGFFWAPECIYMNGKYYMYYSCSMGNRQCAIGVATSTNLTSWTDQGMVVYSGTTGTIGSIDPAFFWDSSNRLWMVYGSHLNGIWMAQINTTTGKALNSTRYNVAGSGSSSEHEAAFVVRRGSYYYLFYNRGVCCNGTSSTYYVQVGRSTSPTGPYVDRNGQALTSGGGTAFLSTSGRYAGPGHVGYFSESGIEFLTYHFYDGLNNGAPTLALSSFRWDSAGWPYASADWVANGRYKIVNRGNNLAWDNWGCGGVAGQAIAQAAYTGITCQRWDFTSLGNGEYRINCATGGLAAEVLNCNSANGGLLDLYSYWGGNCQKWKVERASDGSYVISSVNGNRVVDVPNASTTAGTQLQIFDYNGGTAQRWSIQAP